MPDPFEEPEWQWLEDGIIYLAKFTGGIILNFCTILWNLVVVVGRAIGSCFPDE